MSVLSVHVLNRTLLERQLLAGRTTRSPLDVIEHLVAMQAQEPNWPYVGLWTRITDFRHDDLTSLLYDRQVVRSTVVRGTQHLVSSGDFPWLRPLIQPMLDRAPRQGQFGRENAGLDFAELVDVSRELLTGQTLTRPQLGRLLAEHFPGRSGSVLAGSVEFLLGLVHPPPNGVWGGWGNRASTPFTLAESWIGRPLEESPSVETMVRRYLAAFGPAGVMDVQAWSGLTRLREVLDGMRVELRVFRNEQGKELFDLPGAPLADPDLPVPVRFLPAFDNLVLGHADRTRVIGDEDRKVVTPGAAAVRPTFLVDGFVQGTWSLKGSTLHVTPFRPLSEVDTEAVLAEAGVLLDFLVPDVVERSIAFVR